LPFKIIEMDFVISPSKKNVVVTFTRMGCVACKNEEGDLNHKGRGGSPIIMVMGDEGTPTVVGYTRKGEEQGCTLGWVNF
jgi:hypothetical protein